jgi:hypothetical protein
MRLGILEYWGFIFALPKRVTIVCFSNRSPYVSHHARLTSTGMVTTFSSKWTSDHVRHEVIAYESCKKVDFVPFPCRKHFLLFLYA